MDFAPEETHIALQAMARDFARQEIVPAAEEIDRQKSPEGRFPAALLEKGSRLGLRTLAVPEALGGGGADLLTLCTVGEEIGWGDLGLGATIAQNWCVSMALEKICPADKYEALARDFVGDHGAHLTRADLSAAPPPEMRMPYDGAGENIPASARQAEDGWSLSGFSSHVMNGEAARWTLVSIEGEDGRQAFLLEGGGARIVRRHDPMGMRSVEDVALAFEDVKVPGTSWIDCAPAAWVGIVPVFMVLPASAALGTARRAGEHATAHARERVQGGKPIIEHQSVGFMLADNLMEISAARRSLQAAAWAADSSAGVANGGEAEAVRESYLMRIFVSEACERIARRSMEVWGGAGYMTEAPMERFVRDMASFMHAGEMNYSLRARAMAML